jgi:APA family basic amino acid/polyamine antiporter
MQNEATAVDQKTGFVRELGLFDSSMMVIGAMIGSGIFIVPADMARNIGSPGWLLVAWLFTAVVTVAAAVSYGELAAMFPKAGGMYLYLREAFSPLMGFLYGWTLFSVIQTGTIAAVAVAFARYTGILIPGISESTYLIEPIHISAGYAISLSTGQLVAIVVIIVLTWTNSRGVKYGKIVQNLFTSAKVVALAALILAWSDLLQARRRRRQPRSVLDPARCHPAHLFTQRHDQLRPLRRALRLAIRVALLRRLLARHHLRRR